MKTKENKATIFEDVVVQGIKESLKTTGITAARIETSFKNIVENKAEELFKIDNLEEKAIAHFMETVKVPKVIEIKKGAKSKKMEGLNHSQTKDVLALVNGDIPTMIVGVPGAGKTTVCERVAEALELNFHAMSIGMQTTKTDIMGFIDANGKYQATGFRKAFEKGGLFLMDEVDAGNPNVLIMINSAISNGFVEFPDKMVKKHKDFRFVATANTFGNGVDSKFVGRNKLDAATLDRFVVLGWEIDEVLEDMLTPNKEWLAKVKHLRKEVSKNSMELIITPRMSMFGSKLFAAGFKEKEVREMALFKGLDIDTRNFLEKELKEVELKIKEAEKESAAKKRKENLKKKKEAQVSLPEIKPLF